MTSLNIHFINARGALDAHMDWLDQRLRETHEKAKALMPLRPLDVIVKAGKQVIPEKGHLGYAPEPGMIFLAVDPSSIAFTNNHEFSLERMFAHELHHAARWDGPGYGSTLGEALVSEGLAGMFAMQVCGGQPEPWECLDTAEIRCHVGTATQDWHRTDYGHETWFFGASDLPRWLGYSLGFQLAKRFLAEHRGLSASSLWDTDAQAFQHFMRAI